MESQLETLNEIFENVLVELEGDSNSLSIKIYHELAALLLRLDKLLTRLLVGIH